MHKGDFARAIADFDQAIRIDPRQARFLVSRGLAHREHGDLDSALADFSKAIEIDSRFADAFVNRCVAYEDKGQARSRGSGLHARPSRSIRTDAVAYNDRGVAYEKTGNIDGALADYSKAIELDPAYRDAFANRAVLYDHKGDKERAIADYRAALAKNPAPEDRKDIETALERLGATP